MHAGAWFGHRVSGRSGLHSRYRCRCVGVRRRLTGPTHQRQRNDPGRESPGVGEHDPRLRHEDWRHHRDCEHGGRLATRVIGVRERRLYVAEESMRVRRSRSSKSGRRSAPDPHTVEAHRRTHVHASVGGNLVTFSACTARTWSRSWTPRLGHAARSMGQQPRSPTHGCMRDCCRRTGTRSTSQRRYERGHRCRPAHGRRPPLEVCPFRARVAARRHTPRLRPRAECLSLHLSNARRGRRRWVGRLGANSR